MDSKSVERKSKTDDQVKSDSKLHTSNGVEASKLGNALPSVGNGVADSKVTTQKAAPTSLNGTSGQALNSNGTAGSSPSPEDLPSTSCDKKRDLGKVGDILSANADKAAAAVHITNAVVAEAVQKTEKLIGSKVEDEESVKGKPPDKPQRASLDSKAKKPEEDYVVPHSNGVGTEEKSDRGFPSGIPNVCDKELSAKEARASREEKDSEYGDVTNQRDKKGAGKEVEEKQLGAGKSETSNREDGAKSDLEAITFEEKGKAPEAKLTQIDSSGDSRPNENTGPEHSQSTPKLSTQQASDRILNGSTHPNDNKILTPTQEIKTPLETSLSSKSSSSELESRKDNPVQPSKTPDNSCIKPSLPHVEPPGIHPSSSGKVTPEPKINSSVPKAAKPPTDLPVNTGPLPHTLQHERVLISFNNLEHPHANIPRAISSTSVTETPPTPPQTPEHEISPTSINSRASGIEKGTPKVDSERESSKSNSETSVPKTTSDTKETVTDHAQSSDSPIDHSVKHSIISEHLVDTPKSSAVTNSNEKLATFTNAPTNNQPSTKSNSQIVDTRSDEETTPHVDSKEKSESDSRLKDSDETHQPSSKLEQTSANPPHSSVSTIDVGKEYTQSTSQKSIESNLDQPSLIDSRSSSNSPLPVDLSVKKSTNTSSEMMPEKTVTKSAPLENLSSISQTTADVQNTVKLGNESKSAHQEEEDKSPKLETSSESHSKAQPPLSNISSKPIERPDTGAANLENKSKLIENSTVIEKELKLDDKLLCSKVVEIDNNASETSTHSSEVGDLHTISKLNGTASTNNLMSLEKEMENATLLDKESRSHEYTPKLSDSITEELQKPHTDIGKSSEKVGQSLPDKSIELQTSEPTPSSTVKQHLPDRLPDSSTKATSAEGNKVPPQSEISHKPPVTHEPLIESPAKPTDLKISKPAISPEPPVAKFPTPISSKDYPSDNSQKPSSTPEHVPLGKPEAPSSTLEHASDKSSPIQKDHVTHVTPIEPLTVKTAEPSHSNEAIVDRLPKSSTSPQPPSNEASHPSTTSDIILNLKSVDSPTKQSPVPAVDHTTVSKTGNVTAPVPENELNISDSKKETDTRGNASTVNDKQTEIPKESIPIEKSENDTQPSISPEPVANKHKESIQTETNAFSVVQETNRSDTTDSPRPVVSSEPYASTPHTPSSTSGVQNDISTTTSNSLEPANDLARSLSKTPEPDEIIELPPREVGYDSGGSNLKSEENSKTQESQPKRELAPSPGPDKKDSREEPLEQSDPIKQDKPDHEDPGPKTDIQVTLETKKPVKGDPTTDSSPQTTPKEQGTKETPETHPSEKESNESQVVDTKEAIESKEENDRLEESNEEKQLTSNEDAITLASTGDTADNKLIETTAEVEDTTEVVDVASNETEDTVHPDQKEPEEAAEDIVEKVEDELPASKEETEEAPAEDPPKTEESEVPVTESSETDAPVKEEARGEDESKAEGEEVEDKKESAEPEASEAGECAAIIGEPTVQSRGASDKTVSLDLSDVKKNGSERDSSSTRSSPVKSRTKFSRERSPEKRAVPRTLYRKDRTSTPDAKRTEKPLSSPKKSLTPRNGVPSPSKSGRTPSSEPPKKLPPIKAPVGQVPPPNVKNVKSKIGSLDNIKYKPGGGDKKVSSKKLDWKGESKVGSMENATHKPGGGEKKIQSVKLEFKEKAAPKVGSKDNVKYQPGGGNIKVSKPDSATKQSSAHRVETQKLEFKDKAASRVGSMDNVKHKAGGGNIQIRSDKLSFKDRASPKIGSLPGSDPGSNHGSNTHSPIPVQSPTPNEASNPIPPVAEDGEMSPPTVNGDVKAPTSSSVTLDSGDAKASVNANASPAEANVNGEVGDELGKATEGEPKKAEAAAVC